MSTFRPNRSHTQRLLSPRPQKETEDIPSWEKLNFSDKAKLFSYWVIVINLACLLTFVGCIFLLINTKSVHHKGEMILGFGGMLLWVTLLKYYENTKGYNLILTTFQNASTIAWMAMIGIMPVFIGFGLLGM